jgi:hypothetical protein
VRCQDAFDVGIGPCREQMIRYTWLNGRPMPMGREGFLIECYACGQAFDGKGLRCCSTECERKFRERKEIAEMLRFKRTSEWTRKEPRTHEDWERGWKHIKDVFGDRDPKSLMPELITKRRFPPPDPTTGNYDLKAIDAWQDARSPQFFGTAVKDGASLTRERLRMIEAGSAE